MIYYHICGVWFLFILSTSKLGSLIKHGENLGLNLVHGQLRIKYPAIFVNVWE